MPTTRLERRTEHTVTSPAALRRELELVAAQGYAETRGELEIGLDAIAVPVFGPGSTVIAAVGVSGPSDRIGHQLAQLAELLTSHAQRLSDILGHQRKEGAA
jgi:DNA-binding IclR family transcriptional regulator